MHYDSLGRKVYPKVEAKRIAKKFVCGECKRALLQEVALDDEGNLDFNQVVVFCQMHPAASFRSKYDKIT